MKAPSSSHNIKGSIFSFLSSVFKKHKVRGVLIGGYAIIANKIQRLTFDVDFLMTPEDFARIEPDILGVGYSALNRQSAFVQLKSGNRSWRDLDFLLADNETVEKLIAAGKSISIAGEDFVVPSPLHLVAMKLHSMAENKERESRDLPDVVQLMVMNGIDPLNEDIKEMFLKYRAGHLYERVIKAVRAENEKGK
jgi:hypothetical protein